MDLMKRLNKEEVKELFSKNWLTHDAMWYGLCMKHVGPKKANQINKAAVRMTAAQEIRRVLNLMNETTPDASLTNATIREIIETMFQLIQTSFLTFEFSFPENNVLRGSFHHCFAHDGVTKAGLVTNYECGIVERIKGWFDELGIKYEMKPDFTGCLMRLQGKCVIEFIFSCANQRA